MPTHPKPPARLTPVFSNVDTSFAQDFLSVAASNIETSLIQNGAKPGLDYKHIDLITLAMPLLLEQWRTDKKISLYVGS